MQIKSCDVFSQGKNLAWDLRGLEKQIWKIKRFLVTATNVAAVFCSSAKQSMLFRLNEQTIKASAELEAHLN